MIKTSTLYFVNNCLQFTVIYLYCLSCCHWGFTRSFNYDAMTRLAWKEFLLWIHVNHGAEGHHLEEAHKSISTFHEDVSQTSFTALMGDASCSRVLLLFQEYIGAIGNGNPLTDFWMSYPDNADITLGLLRAAREGDWLLHLASIRAMITWCSVYDKVNYVRFLSYYYAIMPRIPIDHPEVHNSSCKVVSASSLAARIHSTASQWIKPLRKQSTEIHRQQGAQMVFA